MKQNGNNKGYALLWAVVVLMLGTVVVAGALQMAAAMTQRSLDRNQRNQAYYTALSVVDTIAGQLGGNLDDSTPNGAAALAVLGKLATDGKVTMSSVTGLPKEMGNCSVEITLKDDKTMLITATARYNDEEYVLTGIMGGTKVEVVKPPDMGVPGMGLGGMGGFASGGNTGTGSFTTDPNTPIYIWDPSEVSNFVSNGAEIMHMGTLYSKGSLNLKDTYQENFINHLHGEVVCDGDINMSGSFTVGLYKENCCDNTGSSYIYTMGSFRMGERNKVAGNVTATNVTMMVQSPIIKGKVYADSITMLANDINTTINNIDGSALASGYTVECNTLVMSGTAKIKGNVRANSITLSEGANIEGDVEADSITISGNWSGIGIKGKVTANELTMSDGKVTGSVVAGSITMSRGAIITGDVKVNNLEGLGWAGIEGNVSCNSYLGFTGTLGKGYTTFEPPMQLPASTALPFVGPLPSKVPDPTDPPELVAPEGIPALTSKKTETIKNTRVYTVNSDTTISMLHIIGEQPVLFFVEDGVHLTIDEMTPPDDPNKPNLFIQLGSGSQLSIGRDSNAAINEFYLFVWGKPGEGNKVNIGRRAVVYGGINVDKVMHIHGGDTDNGFHWKDPGDNSWMNDFGGQGGPVVPPDPDNPGTPGTPSEDQEMVWKLSGYAAN